MVASLLGNRDPVELDTDTLLKAWPAKRKDGSAGQAANPEGLYARGE